ncbi:MAG TPA: TrmH family RNA methyltransferase [Bryobacteraceae bacterium]|nr:TrmH family RNA methyltransferase [Bryobacteraceae bacterium]
MLVATRNPLNIGAAARAMRNFGFSRLRLVNPYQVAYQEAKSAVRAHDILQRAEEFATVAEAVADCTLVVGTTALGHRELQHPLRTLEYGGRVLQKHLATGSAALLFGSEKFGLSNDDLSHCHWLVRIGTEGSMNLGQAVAVCLYELTRRRAVAKPEPRKLASAEDLERMTTRLTEVLVSSGYVHSASTQAKIRRLVRRLDLPAHDAEVWLGMLRQIQWKLGQLSDDTLGRSDDQD